MTHPVTAQDHGPPHTGLFSRFLTIDGIEGGDREMAGPPRDFVLVERGATLQVERLILLLIADTKREPDGSFPGYGGTLENGIRLVLLRRDEQTELLDLTDGYPIKSQNDPPRYFDTLWTFDQDTKLDRMTYQGVWNMGALGAPLNVEPGQCLVCKIQDDLSAIISLTMLAQGRRIP